MIVQYGYSVFLLYVYKGMHCLSYQIFYCIQINFSIVLYLVMYGNTVRTNSMIQRQPCLLDTSTNQDTHIHGSNHLCQQHLFKFKCVSSTEIPLLYCTLSSSLLRFPFTFQDFRALGLLRGNKVREIYMYKKKEDSEMVIYRSLAFDTFPLPMDCTDKVCQMCIQFVNCVQR